MGEFNLNKSDFLAENNVFALGDKMPGQYSEFFSKQAYLNMLTTARVPIGNVTFEPGCINNWHVHHEGGQILLATGGNGYYQEWGKDAIKLKKGDVVEIPADTKHWHGASKDSWFSHLAIEVPAEGAFNEWLEAVPEEVYNSLK